MKQMIAWILVCVLELMIVVELTIPVLGIAMKYVIVGVFNFTVKYIYFSADGIIAAALFFGVCIFATIFFVRVVKENKVLIFISLLLIDVFILAMVVFGKPVIDFQPWHIYAISGFTILCLLFSLFETVNAILEEALPRKAVVLKAYEIVRQKYGVKIDEMRQEVLAMLGRHDFKMIEALVRVMSNDA